MKNKLTLNFFLNVFEFYEFGIYGIFISSVISLYSPESSLFLSILMSFSILFLSFIRSLSIILFGKIETNKNHKEILLNTFMMGSISFFTGCLPACLYMEMLAPIFLLIFRVIKDICIEKKYNQPTIHFFGNNVTNTKKNLNDFLSSFIIAVSFLLAFYLPKIIVYFYSDISWIWRVPFWTAGLIGVGSIYIRASFLKSKTPILKKRIKY